MNEAFDTIAALVRQEASGLIATIDEAGHLSYSTAPADGSAAAFVVAVKAGKRYVALHLMPLYCHPELVLEMPASLRARMHGKSCLNFAPHKPVPADDLAVLIAAALARA
ncbi:hypothetical protein GRI40_08835 [Altererythrobacter aerius]|uniref:DUF1801 domain-containing protein n=1 Tax=Tsuneonella aeria TaxID=1837929 RepID=A0A6I4TFD6_9SPHN|nr:hypothetical protein [Tsuneonella aeria]MXO75316.1 hypothetical protein [Tsuneonella aeria]